MKKLLIWLLLIGNMATLRAQETSARLVENRFLFVVENSSAMDRSAKAVQQTVRDLIESGVQGQMLPGDTLGIWTYNDRLDTGFPMHHWIPGESKKLADAASDFLKKRRYEKKGELPAVLPPLFSVMKSSRAITVILVSTGNEPIQGTPFDKEINATYAFYARELRAAKLPFVTILVGRNGKMVAQAVNSALGPIQIPRPLIPPDPVVVAKVNVSPATNKLVAATNQPVAPPKIAKSNIIITKTIVTNPLVATNATVITNEIVKTEPPARIAETNSKIFSPEPANKISSSVTNQVAIPETQVTRSIASSNVAYENSSTFKPQAQEVGSGDLPKPKFEGRLDGSHNRAPVEPGIVTATQKNIETRQSPVVATQHANSPKKSLVIGVLFLAVACILIFFVVRSSRSKSQPSIISRSMDERK